MRNAPLILTGLVVSTALQFAVGCGSDDDDGDAGGQAGAATATGGAGGAAPSGSGGAAGNTAGPGPTDLCPELVAASCAVTAAYIPTEQACVGGLPALAGLCDDAMSAVLDCTGPDPTVTCDATTGMPVFEGCEAKGLRSGRASRPPWVEEPAAVAERAAPADPNRREPSSLRARSAHG